MGLLRYFKKAHKKRPTLDLRLKRTIFGSDSTGGTLYVNGKAYCYTLEDEVREVKLKDETCIPLGKYQIKFREATSGKTTAYRGRYPWFTWHLHLQDVKTSAMEFKYIYIHVGNTDDDTSGCILVGDRQEELTDGNCKIFSSRVAFERLYKLVSKHLNKGDEVWISIEQ